IDESTNNAPELDEPYKVSAESDSGLPVTVRLKSGPAIFDGANVVITNLGAVVLTASQTGNTDYAPAEEDFAVNTPLISVSEAGSWPGYARGQAYAVRVSGQRAYVAASVGGVMIFDVSDPAMPRRIGSINLKAPVEDVRDLRVVGNLAYVANWTAGLFIVDVTDPSSPVELGHIGIDGIIWGLDVSDGFAYLVANTSWLYVVDVHDPARPELVSRSEVGKNVNAIAVRDGIAFVADGANGLVIVDVQDARHPFPINTFNTGGYADRIYLQGLVAYIAQGTEGFAVIDISDPGAPRKIGNYSQGQVDDLAVVGSLVLATGYEDVLQIVDVSDPPHPVRMGNVHVPGANTAGVAAAGNRAFVGARWLGLLTADISNPAKPAHIEWTVPPQISTS
ncbi:MAG: hypothetical protein L0Z50_41355, partial [Verrucomicrobiales bacterium]|nr:hypothetical protein [Verrucomicrobiales bacterium]